MDGSLLNRGFSRRGELGPCHDLSIIKFDGYREQINLIPTSAGSSENEIFSTAFMHLSDDGQLLEHGFKNGPCLIHIDLPRHTLENPNPLNHGFGVGMMPTPKLLASTREAKCT